MDAKIFNIAASVLLELIPDFAIEHFRKNPQQSDKNKINQELEDILEGLVNA